MAKRRIRTRLGVALAAAGLAATAVGLSAAPAQAWGESCLDHAPAGANWTELWVSLFDSSPETWASSSKSWSDGNVTITISDLEPIVPGGEINRYTIKTFDWSSTYAIDALIINVWPPGTEPTHQFFSPAAYSGNDVGSASGENPAKYLSFCYTKPSTPPTTVAGSSTSKAPTSSAGPSSSAPSSTSASTTSEAGTSIVRSTTSLASVVSTTDTVPTEVLAETETRPGELARTGGRNSVPLALFGATLMSGGVLLVVSERRLRLAADER